MGWEACMGGMETQNIANFQIESYDSCEIKLNINAGLFHRKNIKQKHFF